MSFCPALAALKNEAHAKQVCSATPASFDFLDAGVPALEVLEPSIVSLATSTETCHFSGVDPKSNTRFTCDVPNAKPVCCALTNSMLSCGRNPNCAKEHFMKILPDLLKAGFDLNQIKNKEYWMSFCPALAALKNEAHAKQVCSATPASFDFLDAGVPALEVLEPSIVSLATSTETCHFSGVDPKSNTRFTCDVPNAKPVCCALTNSML